MFVFIVGTYFIFSEKEVAKKTKGDRSRLTGPAPALLILEFSARRTSGSLNPVGWTEKLGVGGKM